MPRKPKATIETPPAAVAESAAPAPKKRAAPKKPAAATRAASPVKTKASPAKKTVSAAATAADSPKRGAKPKSPKKSVSAAKPNGAGAASRTAKGASFDPSSYHDDIARLAYYFWEQRGRVEGSPEEDWLRAEQELRQSVVVESV